MVQSEPPWNQENIPISEGFFQTFPDDSLAPPEYLKAINLVSTFFELLQCFERPSSYAMLNDRVRNAQAATPTGTKKDLELSLKTIAQECTPSKVTRNVLTLPKLRITLGKRPRIFRTSWTSRSRKELSYAITNKRIAIFTLLDSVSS